MKLKIFITMLLAVAPALAVAKPKTTTVRTHTQSYHDRAPKAHMHEARLHETRASLPR